MRPIRRSDPRGVTFLSHHSFYCFCFFCDHSLSLSLDLVLCVGFLCVDANMFRQASVSEVRARQQMGRAVTFASLHSASNCGSNSLHLSLNCTSLKKKKKKRHVSALLLVPPAQTNFMCSLKPPPPLQFRHFCSNERQRGIQGEWGNSAMVGQ